MGKTAPRIGLRRRLTEEAHTLASMTAVTPAGEIGPRQIHKPAEFSWY
jgi:hypothetical protein